MSENTQKGLKDYRLSEQVGGYEGLQIYRAIAPGGRILVSVRVFPALISRYPLLVEKLRKNIKTLASINHPRISGIIDSGTDSGRPFIVFAHIDAGSLEDRIQSGTLSALNVEQVVDEVAEGLSQAHKRKIIHGNLKPADILFDQEGHVQLVGFGEALLLRSIPNVSSLGSNSFVSFRAPEATDVSKIDEQSDQYSLGLIALQMLTDLPAREALAFLKTEREKLKMGGRERFENASGLPKQVLDVLARALEEKPSKRFSSVNKMNIAFRKALSVDSTPDSLLETIPVPKAPLPQHRRKKKRALALAPLLAFFMVLAAAVPAGIAYWQKNIAGSNSPSPAVGGSGQVIMLPPEHGDATPVDGEDYTVDSQLPTSTPSNSTAAKSPISTSNPSATPMATIAGATSTPGMNPTFTPTPTEVIDGTLAPTETPTAEAATATPDWSLTATPSSTDTPAPTPVPTIRLDRCHSNPGHRRYCTPTPSP